jgi:hypothetical protein
MIDMWLGRWKRQKSNGGEWSKKKQKKKNMGTCTLKEAKAAEITK